ncbi:MAG: Bax inhibitor-1/YccA family protein [Phycisphaerales bacterium]|nr:Bax inhibitor-1/YccA family protein [Phycisphaerales bacterium]
MRLESSNPILATDQFDAHTRWDEAAMSRSTTMTYGGVAIKTSILLTIVVTTAIASYQFLAQNMGLITMTSIGALVGGLVFFLAVRANPRLAAVLAMPFAAVEGLFASGMTVWVMEVWGSRAPNGFDSGMILEAILITCGLLGLMLAAFSAGLIRIEGVFKRVLMFSMAAIGMYYILGWVLSMIGIPILRLGWDSSGIGIAFTAVVIGIATLSLVLDFQEIEAGVEGRAPKHLEWLAAFGLMVTLVWIYIEVLRLLAKLRD